MMKISTLAIALTTSLTCTVAANEDKKQPDFRGLWQTPETDTYLLIQTNGTYNIFTEFEDMKGSWKKDPESDNLLIKGSFMGKEVNAAMQVKFIDEESADFIIGGKPQRFTRPKDKLEMKQVVGCWAGSDRYEEESLVRHLVITHTEDGKCTTKHINLLEKPELYYLGESQSKWIVCSGHFVEFWSEDEEEHVSVAKVQSITPDKISLKFLFEEDEPPLVLTRADGGKLPPPPEGYKKVTEQEFYDALDEICGALEKEE